ncbi:hypothetical protein GX48_02060 [Paracoccidioides brasiliensis]|nr:hypothetical protein GX48_02060 [Paracoccidioides brasiliensis]
MVKEILEPFRIISRRRVPRFSICQTPFHTTSAGRSQACYSSLSSLSLDHEFFRFTRGRFIQNEAHEMAQRYIHFDVEELARV